MNLNEQEQHEADAAASRAMSDRIRQDAATRRRFTVNAPASASPLAVALGELDAAKASGDGERIAAADAAVDRVLDDARRAQADARRAAVPDFAGGARAPVQQVSAADAFNAFMRAGRAL